MPKRFSFAAPIGRAAAQEMVANRGRRGESGSALAPLALDPLAPIPGHRIYSGGALLHLWPMDPTATVRLLAAFLLAVPAAACGDEASRGRALADNVARDFRKECESATAPDAATRRHLAALCACAEAKIAATPMRFSDSDAAIGEKVRAASKACLEELGGSPGEESR